MKKTIDPYASICKVTVTTARMLCLFLLSTVYLAVIHFQESFRNLPREDEQSYRYVSVICVCVCVSVHVANKRYIDP